LFRIPFSGERHIEAYKANTSLPSGPYKSIGVSLSIVKTAVKQTVNQQSATVFQEQEDQPPTEKFTR